MSRSHIQLLLVPLIILAPAFPAAAESVTLDQCFAWAERQSESLQIRAEDIQQANARGQAFLGNALPTLKWEWDNTWQDPGGVDKLERQGFAGFVEKQQTESRFKLEQPIFSGLREFSALKGSKRESARDQLRLQQAREDLYLVVAIAFYDVINAETDFENTAAAWNLAEDQVKELRSDRRLGKSRDSEVFTAKAHAAALKGDLDQDRGRIISTRMELSYLTGQDLTRVPFNDTLPDPTLPGDLNQALVRTVQRDDLVAERENLEAHRLRVRYERGFYWPDVDLTGTYYTQRATFLKDIDWDVLLTVDVPIFQGGRVSANVNEALSLYRQAKLTQIQMERRAIYTVRKLHGELTAAVQEVTSLREATQAARQSYDALRKEYRLGLVTNLDVLQALDLLQAQQETWDTARLRAKLLQLRLRVASNDPEGNHP